MSRSLNKAMVLGNTTKDPEYRQTPQGTPVCTFGVATNRNWLTEAGDKHENTEFHKIVVWNKLAMLCQERLKKGDKVFVEGRLETRKWTGQDGQERQTTEIIADDIIFLERREKPYAENTA